MRCLGDIFVLSEIWNISHWGYKMFSGSVSTMKLERSSTDSYKLSCYNLGYWKVWKHLSCKYFIKLWDDVRNITLTC